MKISVNDYGTFLDFLKSTSHLYGDLDFRNNEFSQVSDDRSTVIQANFDKIFPEKISMRLVMVKTYIALLDLFTKSYTDIEFQVNENKIYIGDEFSNLLLSQPLLEYINNSFISEDELNKKIKLDINNDLILSTELSTMIFSRISKFSETFQSTSVIFEIHDDNKMDVKCNSEDKHNKMVLLKDIQINKSMPNQQLYFPIEIFQTKFDKDVSLNLYVSNDNNNNLALLEFNTEIKSIQTTFKVKTIAIK